jgi:hypothetical protein
MKARGKHSVFLPTPRRWNSPAWLFHYIVMHVHIIRSLSNMGRMNRRKADFRFAYKFLEDEL